MNNPAPENTSPQTYLDQLRVAATGGDAKGLKALRESLLKPKWATREGEDRLADPTTPR
jgi:hypothetical protein